MERETPMKRRSRSSSAGRPLPGTQSPLTQRQEMRTIRLGSLCLIVVLAAFAACDDGAPGEAGANDGSGSTPETATTELAVLHDFQVPGAAPQVRLPPVDEPEIRVGEGSAAIFASKRPKMPAHCLIAAQLRLYLSEASANAAEQLAIYPSHVFNASDKRTGDRFGYVGTALDVRPRSMLAEAHVGWSRWDVTDIVRLWLAREAFPSQGKRAPKKGPIVFTLRDVEGAEPFGSAVVASVETAENAPHLLVRHQTDCSA